MTELENFLNQLGLRFHYRGFDQALLAFDLLLEDEMRLCSIVKDIYMPVAEKCGCTWHSVERNIRTYIAHIWENETSREIFVSSTGYTHKPSVADFLDILFYSLIQCAEN